MDSANRKQEITITGEVSNIPHETAIKNAQPKPAPTQPTLEDLLKAAGPIVASYFEGQKEMQRQSFEFEEKIIVLDNQRDRNLIISGTFIAVSVLILAGILIFQGKDSSAMELIKLVATIISVGIGGYGLGRLRRRNKEGDDRTE